MSNFKLEEIVGHGLEVPVKPFCVKINDSKNIFIKAFEYFLQIQDSKKTFNYKSGYDDICDWLTDNEGKGLLILGNCSLGKTFMVRYVLPAILLKYSSRVLKSFDLNRDNIDEILKKKICGLDDIGTEDVRNEYGTKRLAFAEIVDNAEKNSNILIITTNLTGEDIKHRYGIRIYDRLLAITKRVVVSGEGERG